MIKKPTKHANMIISESFWENLNLSNQQKQRLCVKPPVLRPFVPVLVE